MLASSPDLHRLIKSPVFSADDQFKAIGAVADKAKISGLTGNFLRVVARNRRLFAVPGMIAAFRRIARIEVGLLGALRCLRQKLNQRATATPARATGLAKSISKVPVLSDPAMHQAASPMAATITMIGYMLVYSCDIR